MHSNRTHIFRSQVCDLSRLANSHAQIQLAGMPSSRAAEATLWRLRNLFDRWSPARIAETFIVGFICLFLFEVVWSVSSLRFSAGVNFRNDSRGCGALSRHDEMSSCKGRNYVGFRVVMTCMTCMTLFR